MTLATQFIDPLFNSFFYMQLVIVLSKFTPVAQVLMVVYRLNIYYLILEKMNSFADSTKYDIANMPGAQIQQAYEEKRTDAWHVIENLNIVKRIVSVCKCWFWYSFWQKLLTVLQRDLCKSTELRAAYNVHHRQLLLHLRQALGLVCVHPHQVDHYLRRGDTRNRLLPPRRHH